MKIIIAIFSFFSMTEAFSQCDINQIFDKEKLSKILNKKTDTIYFKAKYLDIGKVVQTNYINKLSSKKLISKKNFTSAISFVPFGTIQKFYLPLNDCFNENNHLKLREYVDQDKTICIRGIVYKGYEKWNDGIFFLVDKIDFL